MVDPFVVMAEVRKYLDTHDLNDVIDVDFPIYYKNSGLWGVELIDKEKVLNKEDDIYCGIITLAGKKILKIDLDSKFKVW
jgi:hypothetical protein